MKTELPIWMKYLVALTHDNMKVSELQASIDVTYSCAHKITAHLESIGWITTKKTGRKRLISIMDKGLMIRGAIIGLEQELGHY